MEKVKFKIGDRVNCFAPAENQDWIDYITTGKIVKDSICFDWVVLCSDGAERSYLTDELTHMPPLEAE
jgi:hypothetical protein